MHDVSVLLHEARLARLAGRSAASGGIAFQYAAAVLGLMAATSRRFIIAVVSGVDNPGVVLSPQPLSLRALLRHFIGLLLRNGRIEKS